MLQWVHDMFTDKMTFVFSVAGMIWLYGMWRLMKSG
jgi:hypothetical protein